MVYLVWEKIRLKRKVLSCVLNSGRYRRLEGREFQTDGAMKLKKRSPQRFHITFRHFLEGVWCLMCADTISMFDMCRHSLSVCYVQTQSQCLLCADTVCLSQSASRPPHSRETALLKTASSLSPFSPLSSCFSYHNPFMFSSEQAASVLLPASLNVSLLTLQSLIRLRPS